MKKRRSRRCLRIAGFFITALYLLFFGVQQVALAADYITSSTCDHSGSPVTIGHVGCFSCGGTGIDYDKTYLVDAHGGKYSGNTLDPGTGYQVVETKEEYTRDSESVYYKKTVPVLTYYRCYNCGDTGYDCIEHDEVIKIEYLDENGNVFDYETGDAEAAQGYIPRRWCSACGPELYELIGKNNCYTDATWKQKHLPKTYKLTVIANSGGDISIAGGSFCNTMYVERQKGAKVVAEAKADGGYEFAGWSDADGNEKGDANPYTVVMPEGDYTLYANFTVKEKEKYTLTVTAGTGGRANASGTTFYENEDATVTAIPDDGYEFVGWTGYDMGDSESTEVTFKMPAKNISVKANFRQVDEVPEPITPSIPDPVVPPVTVPPTPTPAGSIRVTFDADGGYVSPEYKSVTYGEFYGELPVPEKTGYTFYCWYYSEENTVIDAGYPAVTKYDKVLVNENHVLKAIYTKDEEPPVTEPPTPTPAEDKEWYRERHHFYTTDKGFTMDAVTNDSGNYLAGSFDSLGRQDAGYEYGGKITSATQTKRTKSYTVGTDADGNSWYFIISGTSATYVHPKTYTVNGTAYSATTEEVAYITELVFPSALTYNGTTYTVTSIGGGGATYHATTSSEKSDTGVYTSGDSTKWYYQPEYGYYKYSYSSSDFEDYWSANIKYVYGVLGNGYVTSSADVDYIGSTYYSLEHAANDYYVYNTTLKKVTIPQGVEILQGAFIYCQALEEVEIAGATVFGEDSFRAATILDAVLSSSTSYYNQEGVHIYENIRYLYNEDYSEKEKTQVMLEWEEVSPLVPKAAFSEFTSVTTIKTCAFAYRTNMHDITLGTKLAKVESNAFYKSKLDSLTFLGTSANVENGSFDTLGTRGMKKPTLIYCKGGASNVIKYGMKWHNYYELLCGYTVTYSPNGGKLATTGLEEDYVTKTMVKSVLPEITKMKYLLMSSRESVPVAYDVNGHIWYYMDGLIQRMDCLTSYNIVKMEGDKQEAGFYYIETADGDVYYAKINISYEKVELVDIEKLFNIKTYEDAGKECGYNCLEPSSSGTNYAAYYATGSSTASKKYKRAIVTYTKADGITITWKDASSVTLTEESSESSSSGSNVSSYNYWNPKVEVSINGTKVTFTATKPTGESASASYSGTGSGYTEVELLGTFTGSSSSSGTTAGAASSYGFSNTTYKLYALKDASGIRSVVLLGCTRSFSTTDGYSYSHSFSISDSSLNLTSPVEQLMLYYKSSYNNYSSQSYGYSKYLGLGADGTWYEVKVTESHSTYNNEYVNTTGYNASLSQSAMTLPSNLSGIEELHLVNGSIMLLDSDGNIWIGTTLSSLEKQSQPEAMTEMRIYGDLCIFTGESGAIYACGPVEGIGEKFGLTADLTSITALSHLKNGIDVWDYVEYGIYIRDGVIAELATGKELYYYKTAVFDYLEKNLIIVNGVLYELSTNTYLMNLGSTYTIYDDMVITNGNIYRLEDGRYMQEESSDFAYETPFDGIFMNNGILYYKDTFDEVPAVSDTYKFVAVMEPGSIMERYGYGFIKWNTAADGSGTSYTPGEKVPLSSDLKVYAQWKEMNNIIRYDANGGSGFMEDTVLPYYIGETYLRENAFTKTGYEFTGWGIAPEGPKRFNDGDYVAGLQGVITLYAQWKAGKYKVSYASDDIRVTPAVTSAPEEWEFDREYTIKNGLADKTVTVGYELNKSGYPSMSSTPNYVTELSDANKKAFLAFDGWKAYKKTESGYRYLSLKYTPGETAVNVTESAGDYVVFFPVWGGTASRVVLPLAECEGYEFLGWATLSDGEDLDYSEIMAVSGNSTKYQPTRDNETLYAHYAPLEYDITLDWSGVDFWECPDADTMVTMTFDEVGPDITVPEKMHYVFMGYYTELDDTGAPTEGSELYYDKDGKCTKVWRISDGSVDTLYAYWVPDKAIVYDPNYTPLDEGCPEMETTWVDADETAVTLAENRFTRTGYTFLKWNTEPD